MDYCSFYNCLYQPEWQVQYTQQASLLYWPLSRKYSSISIDIDNFNHLSNSVSLKCFSLFLLAFPSSPYSTSSLIPGITISNVSLTTVY